MFITVLACVAAFFGVTLYATHIATGIDRMANDIAGNADPSIHHLGKARTELHMIEARLTTTTLDKGHASSLRAAIEADEERMHEALDAYTTLPFFATEYGKWRAVELDLRSVESEIARILALCDSADEAGADAIRIGSFATEMERADVALDGLIAFDADQGTRLGMQITAERKKAQRTAYALDGIVGALAIAMLAFGGKATRRYLRALRIAREADEAMTKKLQTVAEATVAIADCVGRRGTLKDVLQSTVDAAREIAGADLAALGLSRDPSLPFDPFVHSGVPAGMTDMFGAPRPVGVLAAVMRLGRTLRIDDITRDERFSGIPARHPVMGPFLGVVVRHEGDIIGHLFLAKSPGTAPFSEQDTRAVELLAGFAGAAIQNAKLYAALHREVITREDLLSMVSHDLRNPLAVVYTAARILQVAANLGVREKEQVDVIARNATRMDRMIADLLTAAKVHEGRLAIEPRPQPLAPIVAEAAEALSSIAAKSGVELLLEVPSNLNVVCDAGRIVQALCNLVGNALKVTSRGGAIVVSARARDAAREVTISVRDTGSGIAPEDMPHLFDRFWQAKAHASRGTGLGLFITKGIVESHGGRIDVTSRVGEGSEFVFTLPLAETAHEAEPVHH